MTVISLRITERELQHLNKLAKKEQKDKSTVARELLTEGWKFRLSQQYKSGKISLGWLAKELNVSISEAIDLLSDLGIESPIKYDDYIKGFGIAI